MNARAQLVRRLAHDFIYRCRLALANTGDDAAQYTDGCNKDLTEDVASNVCIVLGIEYDEPPEQPRRKLDGRLAPWAARGGTKSTYEAASESQRIGARNLGTAPGRANNTKGD